MCVFRAIRANWRMASDALKAGLTNNIFEGHSHKAVECMDRFKQLLGGIADPEQPAGTQQCVTPRETRALLELAIQV